MAAKQTPKIAIVADWLTNLRGGEKVVLALAEAFPGAPIYTSVYTPETMPEFARLDVRTTYLQKLPKPLRKLHKFFPGARVRAFQKLDLSEFDIIISSSSAESKQVRKTRSDQVHICYCHTPIRYYWSDYARYKKDPGFGKLNWLVRLAMPFLVPALKKADFKAAQNVDVFIANSEEVQKRIEKYYQKKSTVIYPPVDVGRFTPSRERGDYYVAIGQQVPYKRHDLVVAACTKLGLPLKVFGNGSEHEKLVAMAGPTVEFYTDRHAEASDKAVEVALNSAHGYIYAAEEDFGIVTVEALASGTPAVVFGKGGSKEIVEPGLSGEFFDEQSIDSVVKAIQKLESQTYLPATLRRKSKRFDKSLFISKIRNITAKSVTSSDR